MAAAARDDRLRGLAVGSGCLSARLRRGQRHRGRGQRVTRFVYIVSNVVAGDTAREDFWDTSSLPPGDYVLRVLAQDRDGNQAMVGRDVRVVRR